MSFTTRLRYFAITIVVLAVLVGMGHLFKLAENNLPYFVAYAVQLVIVGVPIALLFRWAAISMDKDRRKQAKAALHRIFKRDPAIQADKDSPNKQFVDVFWQYKQNWNNQALAQLKAYATKDFCKQTEYLQLAMQSINRTFTFDHIDLKHFDPFKIQDKVGTADDTLLFQASYEATLTLSEDGVLIAQKRQLFYEFWYFIRSGNGWRLADMASSELGIGGSSKQFANFAAKHGLVRTFPPLGVLLPRTGALFEGVPSLIGSAIKEWLDFQYTVQPGEAASTLGVRDHYVGQLRGAVIQLYTYIANNSVSSTFGYVPVAQVSLPKSYGHIVVRPKALVNKLKLDSSYEHVILEWPDFNERYDVFATNRDLLASLELINPEFMAFLYDHLPSASLEVQGNSVYIYALTTAEAPTDRVFEGLFGIAVRAHKELKR